MKKNIHNGIMLLAVAAALMAAACEKEIKVDIDAQEPKVVVNGANEVGQPISVGLTLSRPTFSTFYVRNDEDYFQSVTDATLTLSVDGGAALTATRDGGTYTFAHTPQSGEVLRLDIAVPGQQPLSATATVPYKPAISNVDTGSSTSTTDYYSLTQFNISFTLNDRAESDDYYSVRLWRVDTVYHTRRDSTGAIVEHDTTLQANYQYFSCTDYLLVSNADIDIEDPSATSTFSGYEMLFTDASIGGTSHTIRIATDERYNYNYYSDDYKSARKETDTTTIRSTYYLMVSALSRDHYLYLQTFRSYDDDALLALISEPVQIHSNIEGGIGIFGVSARDVTAIRCNERLESYSWKNATR